MAVTLFLKARVKGYIRPSDGVYVRPHDTKVHAKAWGVGAKPKQKKKGTPAKSQKSLKLIGGGPHEWSGAVKTPPVGAIRPKLDDDGHRVKINAPTEPSDPSTGIFGRSISFRQTFSYSIKALPDKASSDISAIAHRIKLYQDTSSFSYPLRQIYAKAGNDGCIPEAREYLARRSCKEGHQGISIVRHEGGSCRVGGRSSRPRSTPASVVRIRR